MGFADNDVADRTLVRGPSPLASTTLTEFGLRASCSGRSPVAGHGGTSAMNALKGGAGGSTP